MTNHQPSATSICPSRQHVVLKNTVSMYLVPLHQRAAARPLRARPCLLLARLRTCGLLGLLGQQRQRLRPSFKSRPGRLGQQRAKSGPPLGLGSRYGGREQQQARLGKARTLWWGGRHGKEGGHVVPAKLGESDMTLCGGREGSPPTDLGMRLRFRGGVCRQHGWLSGPRVCARHPC